MKRTRKPCETKEELWIDEAEPALSINEAELAPVSTFFLHLISGNLIHAATEMEKKTNYINMQIHGKYI